jgi:hypothetical protein
MKHRMLIFSPAGDSAVAEWDVADKTEVAHAKGVFDAAIADGWAPVTPSKVEGEGAIAVGKEFDPSLEELYLLRPIAGG